MGTNAAGCANPNGGTAIALSDAAANCRGSDVNAIDYPMWKVKIGQTAAGSGGLDYFVPNGYCVNLVHSFVFATLVSWSSHFGSSTWRLPFLTTFNSLPYEL